MKNKIVAAAVSSGLLVGFIGTANADVDVVDKLNQTIMFDIELDEDFLHPKGLCDFDDEFGMVHRATSAVDFPNNWPNSERYPDINDPNRTNQYIDLTSGDQPTVNPNERWFWYEDAGFHIKKMNTVDALYFIADKYVTVNGGSTKYPVEEIALCFDGYLDDPDEKNLLGIIVDWQKGVYGEEIPLSSDSADGRRNDPFKIGEYNHCRTIHIREPDITPHPNARHNPGYDPQPVIAKFSWDKIDPFDDDPSNQRGLKRTDVHLPFHFGVRLSNKNWWEENNRDILRGRFGLYCADEARFAYEESWPPS